MSRHIVHAAGKPFSLNKKLFVTFNSYSEDNRFYATKYMNHNTKNIFAGFYQETAVKTNEKHSNRKICSFFSQAKDSQ